MSIDIGDNLAHLLQLGVVGAVCVALSVWTRIDTTALLTAFIGVSGALAGFHLAATQTAQIGKQWKTALSEGKEGSTPSSQV